MTTRLQQLEASLGVSLFHRVAGRLVITPAGQTLSGYADRLLRLAQEAKLSVTANGVPHGPLAIGSMETTAASRLPRILADFHARYPDVDLHIEAGPTVHLIQRVLDFGLDAALIGGKAEHPAIASRVVFEEELVLITDKAHLPVAVPQDVGNAMLLVFRSGCSYRRALELWLASGGIAGRRTIEFGTFEGIIGCVAAGMGVSLMPRILIDKRGLDDSVGVHSVPARYGRMKTMMIWRRDLGLLPAREAFVEAVCAAAARTDLPGRSPVRPRRR